MSAIGRKSLAALVLSVLVSAAAAQEASEKPPSRVYVPYEDLDKVFRSEKQGVFLPYEDFQKLWKAAQASPAGVESAPADYLISTARFTGRVGEKLARMDLELTVDILSDGWVQVPLNLRAETADARPGAKSQDGGQLAISEARFVGGDPDRKPLLRLIHGQYHLLARGKGRRVLQVEFVCRLSVSPGRNVLSLPVSPATISTLELLIPEQNVQVQIDPILAATTSTVQVEGAEMTRLQAFLGGRDEKIRLTWQPRTQAAEQLAAVVIAEQIQHIHVGEALIGYDVTFNYDIRRQGVDRFDIQLPGSFRVISVDGNNLGSWDLQKAGDGQPAGPQTLTVRLHSPAKGAYRLRVRMERFLKEDQLRLPLSPVFTRQVLRRTGLLAVSHAPRRAVEVTETNKQLVRVDVGRLDPAIRNQHGVTAWRFVSADYAAALAIETVQPRLSLEHHWLLHVQPKAVQLRGELAYKVERAGIFSLQLRLPEPWEIRQLGPESIVDDYELTGQGDQRVLEVTLKSEIQGSFRLQLEARADRPRPDADLRFLLPAPLGDKPHLIRGKVLVALAESLRAEISQVHQLKSIPVREALGSGGSNDWSDANNNAPVQPAASVGPEMQPAMAFEFLSIDRDSPQPPGFDLAIAVRPAQVSAEIHRLVDIQAGVVNHQAVIDYTVRYAPVRTLYVKLPAALANVDLHIRGENIQQSPRVDEIPESDRSDDPEAEPDEPDSWLYHKIVLQSPVIGNYRLTVGWRRRLQLDDGKVATILVPPVFAAGQISDQSGQIAVARAETLALGAAETAGLSPADPSSPADLPFAPHRETAMLAFTYNAPPYRLALPVRLQQDAEVITTIVDVALIEQVLGRDGTLNARATYLISTSRPDRLAITYPQGASIYPPRINGQEVSLESASGQTRVIRLQHGAGQVNRLLLELPYGLSDSGPGAMPAPQLPEQVPVQRTYWRVWVPEEARLLHYDMNFARLKHAPALQGVVAEALPAQPQEFPSQGRMLSFVRQGPAEDLNLLLLDRKWLAGIVGVMVLATGTALLLVGGFLRGLAVLLGLALLGLVSLLAPLLARNVAGAAIVPFLLVLALWVLHSLFYRFLPVWREHRARQRVKPAPEGPLPETPEPESPVSDDLDKE